MFSCTLGHLLFSSLYISLFFQRAKPYKRRIYTYTLGTSGKYHAQTRVLLYDKRNIKPDILIIPVNVSFRSKTTSRKHCDFLILDLCGLFLVSL